MLERENDPKIRAVPVELLATIGRPPSPPNRLWLEFREGRKGIRLVMCDALSNFDTDVSFAALLQAVTASKRKLASALPITYPDSLPDIPRKCAHSLAALASDSDLTVRTAATQALQMLELSPTPQP